MPTSTKVEWPLTLETGVQFAHKASLLAAARALIKGNIISNSDGHVLLAVVEQCEERDDPALYARALRFVQNAGYGDHRPKAPSDPIRREPPEIEAAQKVVNLAVAKEEELRDRMFAARDAVNQVQRQARNPQDMKLITAQGILDGARRQWEKARDELVKARVALTSAKQHPAIA